MLNNRDFDNYLEPYWVIDPLGLYFSIFLL